MAQAGVDALKTCAIMNYNQLQDDVSPPRDPDLQNLIKKVFAHDDIINDKVKVPEEGYNFYKMNMQNLKLKRVHGMSKLRKYRLLWGKPLKLR
jgi:hypothetical protein